MCKEISFLRPKSLLNLECMCVCCECTKVNCAHAEQTTARFALKEVCCYYTRAIVRIGSGGGSTSAHTHHKIAQCARGGWFVFFE